MDTQLLWNEQGDRGRALRAARHLVSTARDEGMVVVVVIVEIGTDTLMTEATAVTVVTVDTVVATHLTTTVVITETIRDVIIGIAMIETVTTEIVLIAVEIVLLRLGSVVTQGRTATLIRTITALVDRIPLTVNFYSIASSLFVRALLMRILWPSESCSSAQ
jgi:hypothetical protein